MYCARHVSGITFIMYAQFERLENQIIKSFESNKTKGPKQDSQIRPRSHIHEGAEL